MAVRTGVTDGLVTEVTAIQEDQVLEDLEIISKVLTPSTSPQPDFGRGRGPGGGGFGGGRGRF